MLLRIEMKSGEREFSFAVTPPELSEIQHQEDWRGGGVDLWRVAYLNNTRCGYEVPGMIVLPAYLCTYS
jgi:hypothetical protein